MERIKITLLFGVLIIIECFGFRLLENIHNLKYFGRKLEKHPFSEVSPGVLDRLMYGRSIFVRSSCPYGTIRIGHDCVPPRSDPDYEYDE